jgi:hypothetical protein
MDRWKIILRMKMAISWGPLQLSEFSPEHLCRVFASGNDEQQKLSFKISRDLWAKTNLLHVCLTSRRIQKLYNPKCENHISYVEDSA